MTKPLIYRKYKLWKATRAVERAWGNIPTSYHHFIVEDLK
ncbi:MAG: hypothetical protein NVS1B10_08740 [Candidatus Saccharimonadales bacterium]